MVLNCLDLIGLPVLPDAPLSCRGTSFPAFRTFFHVLLRKGRKDEKKWQKGDESGTF